MREFHSGAGNTAEVEVSQLAEIKHGADQSGGTVDTPTSSHHHHHHCTMLPLVQLLLLVSNILWPLASSSPLASQEEEDVSSLAAEHRWEYGGTNTTTSSLSLLGPRWPVMPSTVFLKSCENLLSTQSF